MTTVPSNLIPVRVTQLPLAPVADENSLLFIVYQGKNYQIRAGDLLSVAGVPTSRQVIAGTGLTGGGQLSSNVTLSIAPGGVGSAELANSGVTPGVYGSATNIPVFTVDDTGRVVAATSVPATLTGYVPNTRQVVAGTGLSGGGSLSTNITIDADLSNAAPQAGFQSGSAGVSNEMSRSDHKHPAVNLGVDNEVDGVLGLNNGGTARSIVPDAGTVVWCGADGLYLTSVGSPGQVLVSGGSGSPTWGSALIVSDQPANFFYAGPVSGPDAPTTFRAMVIDDLPASGVAAASYGTASSVPTISVNSKGQITSASNTTIAVDASQISTGTLPVVRGGTGLSTTPTNGQIDIGNGSGFTRTTLTASTGISITNGAGSITVANDGVLSVSGGTTGLTPASPTAGNIVLAGTLAVANGGTGATNAANARTNLGAAASGANSDITSMTGVTGGISSPDFIQFDSAVSPLPTDATGKLYYNSDDQFSTLSFQMNGSVIQKIGEEQYFRVKCSSAVTKGQVVMFTGTLGASGGLTAAPATGLTPEQSNYILGVAAESGATNDWIFVTYFGEVKNLNTTGGAESWTDGTVLYYNPAVTGGLTKNKPSSPNAIAIVAAVVHANSSNGVLFIRPTYGTVLGGTDGNVQFGTLNNGDVIVYDSVDQRWENAAQSSLSVGSASSATTATTATNVAGGAAGSLVYQTGAAATTTLAIGASTYLLTSSGTAPQWSNPSGVTVGSASSATNLAGGVASEIPYQTGAGSTAFISNGTSGQVLRSNGTSAPSWSNLDGGTF